MTQQAVILYELNEVPWAVVDQYLADRPRSCMARLVSQGSSMTTVVTDDAALQPWRTWPTLHKSLLVHDHHSFDLGQDPHTFRGPAIWDAAEDAGLRVGLWGPLQSWPARPFRNGGFYVPDTFARDATTFPAVMSRFQAFNLAATRENSFSSDAPLHPVELVRVGADLGLRGMIPSSVARLSGQLIRERLDGRYRGRRAIMQALPSFDLYWRLHRRYRPHLSVFFTNHVAAMMHRYWGDAMPAYAESYDYRADHVFEGFLRTAMDVCDGQLQRIVNYVSHHPETTLVVAASMGQAAIPVEGNDRVLVLEEPQRLIATLGLGHVDVGLAMYPRVSLSLTDDDAARKAADILARLRLVESQRPVFRYFRVHGQSVSFEVDHDADPPDGEPLSWGDDRLADWADLGLVARRRLGGVNTAYHVPEGMLLSFGMKVTPQGSRGEVDILDVAPSLLADILDARVPETMRGKPGLFR